MKSIAESILNLSQVIKATPFSEEGWSCLENLGINKNYTDEQLKNDFINKVYVEPFCSEESKDAEATDEEEYKEEYDEELAKLFKREDEIIDDNIQQKRNFENELINKTQNLFIIKATAGSGKTTYLNWLFIEKLKESNVLILDIDNTKEIHRNVRILDNALELGTIYDIFVGRVISALLYQINQCIRIETQESMEAYKKRMKSFVDCYTKVFIEAKEIKNSGMIEIPKIYNIFKTLRKFAESDTYKFDTLSHGIIGHLNEIIFENNEKFSKQTIIILFNILFRFLYCKQETTSIPHFCFIAIDNIERLIGEDPNKRLIVVHEHELGNVHNAITESIEETSEFMRKADLSFRDYFVVILSLRDTSVRYFHTIHNTDQSSPLDITTWFDAQKIYNSKVNNYYPVEDKKQLDDDDIYKAFNLILSDTNRPRGLFHIISKMYNFNKRRIPIVLLERVLQLNVNAPILRQYLYMWERTVEEEKKKKDKDQTLIWVYRHLCRKSIMRLLYNHYDINNLWKSLKVGNHDMLEDVASYTRKVLTFLYINRPNIRSSELKDFPELSVLVNNVIKPVSAPNSNDFTNDLCQLAEILYRMSDIHMVPFDWSPLVELIIDNSSGLSIDIIKDALMNSEKNQRYRIKITDAGEVYSLLNVDFEYFAARYCDNNRLPLFATENLKKKKDGKEESFPCLKIIETVRQKTEKCILKLMEYDYKYFFQQNNSHPYERMYNGEYLIKGTPHPILLIRNHVGYLHSFKKYISYIDDNTIQKIDREKIEKRISQEIFRYIKMLKDLMDKDNDGYFKEIFKNEIFNMMERNKVTEEK